MIQNVNMGIPSAYNTGSRQPVGRKEKSRSTVGEKRLSAKAQKYLDSLRAKYGDYDIIAADDDDDRAGLLAGSDREFAVVFSSEELEKMADDAKYAQGKLNRLETIVNMSTKICEENGFVLETGDMPKTPDGGYLRSLTFSIGSDGVLQFSAELEDLSGRKSVISATSEDDFVRKLQALKANQN